ncbi:hypothetical protein DICPUDRAFT_74736 [Dictyostelium purpureum]|uniref:Uncharacterized protein n=1 Tax=Dictyostelium purpureum TaxID=5786 RepID=F0Z8L4_DICPU|nr:uncharacterized protein DICPUDRAFT_74736 [Dictyostelium purpureum]EGC39778.1 hypothetical protein DICPUDRAFT_74736 [Dictyostelium purpureum]|eukprot:XP_003283764.1 hypothetical protein DICPUDRAFT_74736 [Dictyostelium purpureum]
MSTSPMSPNSKSISPTSKKVERITFINRLEKELEGICKSNEMILGAVPLQIDDSYNSVTSLLNCLEDLRPQSQKSFSKSNLKIMELEKSINQIKTRIRDNQIKKNNIQLQRELEKELDTKLLQLDELTRKFQTSLMSSTQQQQQSQQQQQININDRQNLFKSIKSSLSNLQISNQRVYQLTNSFYSTLKGYFNLLLEISNRIPAMRGGIDIVGVVSIGQDDSTEILERMCDSIYESSKVAYTFMGEIPSFEKQWYSYHFKIFERVMDRASEDSFDDTASNGSGRGSGRGKKQQKGILAVLKRFKGSSYRQSINLLEKIEVMEYENELQQRLNQNLLNNTSQIYNSHKLNFNQQSPQQNTGPKDNTIKRPIVYEPLNSSFTMMDAVVLDLQNLLSFPENEIINHIDTLINKCQMLFETFNLLKARYSYFKEKLTRWIDNNSTIIRVASYECDAESFKIPDFRSVPDIQYKVKVLYKVMHSYFTTCLVATPMVYLTPDSWKLSSHSDFRSEKRAQIDKLLLVLKSNYPIDYDVLRKLILEFTDILVCALDIQIPLMLEVYEDDSTLTKRKNWSHERKLLKETISKSIHQLKYYQASSSSAPPASLSNSFNNNENSATYQELLGSSVKMLQSIMLQFFKFKPIGRPHLYKNDHQYKLISESKKRYDYRTSILI